MIAFNKIKTIFLDYDGTSHNSIKIYAPAFKKAYEFIVNNTGVSKREWSDSEISYWLGFSSKDMWIKFLPEVSLDIKIEASDIIKKEMTKQIEDGDAELYTGVIETLNYLKTKGYKLVFISNCGKYYMDTHTKLFNLDQYFDKMFCSEQFGFIPKYEILKEVMLQFPKEMVIIGDRFHDIESGIKNNIYTIGCLYGFGNIDELSEADLVIDDIRELTHYF